MDSKKDKIDMLSKIVDSLYKKLVVLVAISGGFGAYGVKFLQESNWVGYIFILLFGFVAIAIFLTYIKLNEDIKKLKRIYDE
jgi:hypothetical protein